MNGDIPSGLNLMYGFDYTLTSEGKEKKIENRKQHYHLGLNRIYWSQNFIPPWVFGESKALYPIFREIKSIY